MNLEKTMRPLNTEEINGSIKTLERADFPHLKLPEKLMVSYSTQESFTVAELIQEDGITIVTGVAKRNSKDRPNPQIGEKVALRNARLNMIRRAK